MRQIFRSPSDEVVDPDHLVAVGKETVRQVRSEEAGGSGDHHTH
jgi:hypothetical protein